MSGIELETHGRCRVIRLNRPHVRNAVDAATSYEVDAALTEADNDDAIGAVIFTGAGDRAFCSGMDLKEAAERGIGHGLIPGRGFCGITERTISKPVIAAINGAAVAGGFEITLACDMVVAADHAVFGLSEAKRGLFAYAGGVQRLARALPRAIGMEIILTANPMGAQRMYELGVVNRVVPYADLMKEALALAEAVLANAPVGLIGGKRLFDASIDVTLERAMQIGHELGAELLHGNDSAEGVKAYAQKRDAQFTGN